MRNLKLQLAIIVLLTFITYSNIFQNTYTGGDDTWLLLNWKEAYSLSYIPKFFLGKLVGDEKATYRPIRSSIIPMIHQFTGANPFGFHVYSMFIILSSTILVYFITKELVNGIASPFGKLRARNDKSGKSVKSLLPFITALLFGLHPIHTEAITFMLGAIESSFAVFLLGSVYLFIKFRKSKNITFFYLSVFLSVLSYFTNELALILPFLILVYDFLFTKKFSRHNGAFFLTLIFYLVVRIYVVGIATKGSYLANSFYLTMLTMVKGLIRYISLLIFPHDLSIYPKVAPGIESYTGWNAPMDKILSQSILDWDIIASIIIIVSLLVIAWKLKKKFPIITFGIFWFFISLVPISHIIPLNVILQERYVYLASFGFVLLVAFVILNLFQNHPLPFPLPSRERVRVRGMTMLLLIALFYGIVTYQRNRDWHDPISFWSKTVTQVPNFFWANVFLANSYANDKQYDQALKYYYKSLEIVPNAKGILENIDKVNKLKANQTQ